MSGQFIITDQGAYPFLTIPDQDLLKQCACDAYMASGPGGQKRNRTLSAVRLTHRPTGLSAVAEESRSQHENRMRACRRLKNTLALRLRMQSLQGWALPEEIRPYCSTPLQKINPKNALYPLLCAVMLDLLHAQRGNLSQTARILNMSTGQCSRLFTSSKDIMKGANAVRTHFGLRPLRLSE